MLRGSAARGRLGRRRAKAEFCPRFRAARTLARATPQVCSMPFARGEAHSWVGSSMPLASLAQSLGQRSNSQGRPWPYSRRRRCRRSPAQAASPRSHSACRLSGPPLRPSFAWIRSWLQRWPPLWRLPPAPLLRCAARRGGRVSGHHTQRPWAAMGCQLKAARCTVRANRRMRSPPVLRSTAPSARHRTPRGPRCRPALQPASCWSTAGLPAKPRWRSNQATSSPAASYLPRRSTCVPVPRLACTADSAASCCPCARSHTAPSALHKG
jgi:hypothetical protein